MAVLHHHDLGMTLLHEANNRLKNSTALILVQEDNGENIEVPSVAQAADDATQETRLNKDTLFQLLQLAFEPGQKAMRQRWPSAAAQVAPSNIIFHGTFLFALDGLHIWQAASLDQHSRDFLIGNFIEELEVAGLWHWGVYVALYLTDEVQRRETVFKLLNLHCPANEEEAFKKSRLIEQDIEDTKVLVETAKTSKARAYNERRLRALSRTC